MAGQKTPRPAKRHLVRWTDEMDKKLLLTIQSVCNADGVKIPWDKVGRIMGDRISDGAVIQHLAKLRQRMVKQGLSVPPPLRRGGGNLISTGNSAGSAKMAVTIASEGPSDLAQETNIDDEEDFDADKATDMDEEYGQPRTKRTKRGKKAGIAEKASSKAKGRVGIKIEESDGTGGSSGDQKGTPVVNSKKRKREMKKTGLGKGKGLPKGKALSPSNRPRRSSVDYADLNGGYDSKDDYDSAEDEEYVGAAAPYMKFAESPVSDEDVEKDNKQRVQLSESATPSKVVVLQVGTAHLLKEAERLELGTAIKSGYSDESDEESEVETDDEHVDTMDPLVNPNLDLGQDGAFSVFPANPAPIAYHQYNNTTPIFGGFTPAANGQLTAGNAFSSSAVNNGNWFQGPGCTHSSFTANTIPSSFSHPVASSTRITIPQQVNGPSVEMVPTSATSAYSEHTPGLMGHQYYAALDEGMNDMDPFSHAYSDPTTQDPMFGPDGGFDYFNF